MQNAVLCPMFMDQSFQHPFSLDSQLNENLAAILRAGPPLDQAQPLGPVDQLNYTVMVALELFSEFSDRSEVPFREPLNGEDKVILLGGDPLVANRPFAVSQEAAQGMPEGGNPLELSLR